MNSGWKRTYSRVPLYLWGLMLLICIGLFIFKWEVLALPYYWDEAWVYVPAIRTMESTGPCLAPGCIPVDLNTGHPMLFYFLEASWMRLTGTGLFTSHLFPMLLSCLLILLTGWCFTRLFNATVGLIAVVLFSLQPIFIAQSSFLLAEVLLSIFTLLTFYYYFSKNYTGFIIAATGMLYTKEPGIILLGALGLIFLIQHFIIDKSRLNKQFFLQILVFIIPVAIGAIFFLLQKIKFGWFLFPRHANWFDPTFETVKIKFYIVLDFVFIEQGRISLIKILTLAVTLFFPRAPLGWRIIALAAWFWANHQYDNHHNINPLLVHNIGWILFVTLYLKFVNWPREWSFPLLGAALYCLIYYLFSAANFLSLRYLLCTFPLLCGLLAAIFYITLRDRAFWFAVCSISGFFLLGYNVYKNRTDKVIPFDVSLTYADMVKAQRDMVAFCESMELQQENIYATFLVRSALSDPYDGYLSGPKFENAGEDTTDFRYLIKASNEESGFQDSLIIRRDMKLLKRFQYGYCYTELYKKE